MGESIITVRLDNAEIQRAISSLRFWQEEKKKKIVNQVRVSAFQIQKDAAMAAPVATNRLRSSIQPIFRRDGLGASVGTNIKYAEFVEYGRRAGGMPPVDMIEQWVRKKITRDVKEARGIAFVIARKIGQRGTNKQPFLFPAAERERPRYRAAMIRILRENERSK